ncbi:taxis cluster protein CheD [Babesia caballi]|uniref:Taxis cluster protein CheD n=1 Tax=Babesia caballi TaxID=5871 RepID=A0AAV4M122_BABCB|nr:taxis cluster protein CheD [Babesia caballi]
MAFKFAVRLSLATVWAALLLPSTPPAASFSTPVFETPWREHTLLMESRARDKADGVDWSVLLLLSRLELAFCRSAWVSGVVVGWGCCLGVGAAVLPAVSAAGPFSFGRPVGFIKPPITPENILEATAPKSPFDCPNCWANCMPCIISLSAPSAPPGQLKLGIPDWAPLFDDPLLPCVGGTVNDPEKGPVVPALPPCGDIISRISMFIDDAIASPKLKAGLVLLWVL